ncbi:IS66 family transposase [Flexibacterium corallicola]|uniref:IS66 family transposase n=1 Tax=Flexibacterium corallicola TaxID=3037259 RepID=UPI00286ED7F5|nr:transposase [Pseudovibrio sp. M1P-2-3]
MAHATENMATDDLRITIGILCNICLFPLSFKRVSCYKHGMLNTLSNLPEDPTELKNLITFLSRQVQAQALKIEQLQQQLHGANRHRFGTRSENLEQLQLTLENQEIVTAGEAPTIEEEEQAQEDKQKPKRKSLPGNLPRNIEVLDPGEVCPCCRGRLKTLGEDITEELEYIPGRFVVNRLARPRKACSCCEKITQALLPSRPIERGRPGPGLLAHVLVSKFADHLPLYRQSQIYAREGLDLSRSTLAGWVGRPCCINRPFRV